ncbi:hypothetical protein [Mesorhizobium sp. B2-8-3]|uniref:hypothetical protein n=1 Tax=Mesorhizobium sp. B2-8-3 TaxID=2589905 RepID=UPI00112D7392|nr:hypothetical protein [Mesorhizobium sp. B2-8-3]TPJ33390.1 hypothetical protein FJ418_15220 [Mesorhizobium sp. B2-8-3]
MGEPIVIHALVAKRAELSGQVLDLDRQKAVLKAQLQTIDEALAIFGYARSPHDIKPRRAANRLFKRNELARLLRRDGGQGTNRETALRLMAVKGWDVADRELADKVTDSVKGAKKWQRQQAGG